LSLGNGRFEAGVDTASTSGHSKLMEQDSLTDRVEVERQCDHLRDDECDQPSDCIAGHAEMNALDVEEHETVPSPSSLSNTVRDSDLSATAASTCMSVSISHCSPDSGVYSKAVTDSVIASQSTATESVDITTDFSKSLEDRKADANTLDAKTDDDDSSGRTINEDLLPETSSEAWTAVEPCTSLDDDSQNTLVDERSSIISAGTDDTVSQTIDETEKRILNEAVQSAVAPAVSAERVKCEDVDTHLPSNRHVSCLGSQEMSDYSDSDAEDDAVLKTVVAVRTKAVDHAECVDSVKLFGPDDTADVVKLQNDVKGIDSSPGETCDEFTQERTLHGGTEVDSSGTGRSKLTINHDVVENNLQAETGGTGTEGSNVVMDFMDDRNTQKPDVEASPGTNELLSTLSTELDQYMTAHVSDVTDTSFDNQTIDSAANDSDQLLDLMAAVKMFSEDEDLTVDSAGQRLRARTRSFTSNSNHSLPLSPTNSIKVQGTEEIACSSTLSTLQPRDAVKQLNDLSSEEKVREGRHDSKNATDEIPLTTSMEDLKLRPSKKKLEFDCLPAASSPLVFVDPPDEYRDRRMSAENEKSFMSPAGDLTTANARWPAIDLNVRAKEDHLQRYLKSLATLPGYDTTHEELNNWPLQDSQPHSHDVSDNFNFDGENGIELPWRECSTSVLMPDLLHQSDDVAELSEDVCLEAQLQQYEVMKRRLMEEHRRSLERLLAEQERQMSLLQSHVMGQTMSSGSSSRGRIVARKSSSAHTAAGDFDRCTSKLLPSDVPDTFNSQSLINELLIPSHCAAGQTVSSSDAHVAASVGEMSSSGRKMRSPAGVFYDDRQVISREPSCSTIRSGDTESEFAYKSPAVLRCSRRVTPTCSPRDSSKTQQDPMCHSLMATQDSHLHSSGGLEHPAVHSHRLNRRFVDMFAEAST